METTQEFIDMDTGVLVDSINKQHAPTLHRVDNRYDFLEKPDSTGWVKLRFTLNEISSGGSDIIHLFGSDTDLPTGEMEQGMFIGIRKSNLKLLVWMGGYGGPATGYVRADFPTPLTGTNLIGVTYDLVVVKTGTTFRAYWNTVPLPTPEYFSAGTPTISSNPFIIGSSAISGGQPNKAIVTVTNLVIGTGEPDRKNGAAYLHDLDVICREGNYVPPRLHPSVVEHLTCQEKYGNKLHSCVEQYNYAKNEPGNLALNNGTAWTAYSKPERWTFTGTQAAFTSTPNNQNDGAIAEMQVPPKKPGLKYKISFNFTGASVALFYLQFGNYNYVHSCVAGYNEVIFTAPHGVSMSDYLTFITTANYMPDCVIYNVVFEFAEHHKTANNHCELLGYSSEELGITGAPQVIKDLRTKEVFATGALQLTKVNRSLDVPAAAIPTYPATFTIEFCGSVDNAGDILYSDLEISNGLLKSVYLSTASQNAFTLYIGDEITSGINTNFSVISFVSPFSVAPKHILISVDTTRDSPYASMASNHPACDIRIYVDGAEVQGTLSSWQAIGVGRTTQNPFNPARYPGSNLITNTSTKQVWSQTSYSGAGIRNFNGFNLISGVADPATRYTEYKRRGNVFTTKSLFALNPTMVSFPYLSCYSSGVYHSEIPIAGTDLTSADATSLEAATGLPEIKKGISLDHNFKMQVPLAGVGNFISGGDFSIFYTVYYDGKSPAGKYLFTWFNSGVIDLRFTVGFVYFYMGGTTGYYAGNYPNVPGFYTFEISRIGFKHVEIKVNGVQLALENVSMLGPNGNYAANPTFPDLTVTDSDSIQLYDIPGSYAISFGVNQGAFSAVDSLNLYANSRLSNPKSHSSLARYYQLASIDSAGYTPELVNNGAALYTGWDGTYANPASPDFAVRTIADIRN